MRQRHVIALAASCALVWPAPAQVVILAHPASGDFVVVTNRASPKVAAMQQAYKKGRGDGWKPLLSSTVPGFGAMFCFRAKGQDVRYFTAEGAASASEAIVRARNDAIAAARGTGATVYICGGPWENRNVHPLEAQEVVLNAPEEARPPTAAIADSAKPGLIGGVRREVQGVVACDPSLPLVSAAGLRREEANPELPQTEHAKLRRRGAGGRAPCLIEQRTPTGVRG